MSVTPIGSIIVKTAVPGLKRLLFVFSLIVLLRGHNDPGGGFVGGLLGAGALTFEVIGSGVSAARQTLRVAPHTITGAGLLLALASGIPAILNGDPFLSAWTFGVRGDWNISTVLFFDIGVYMVVIGTVLLIIFALSEE
jgi:multicomponent Na+:H+ antiporter subunit B